MTDAHACPGCGNIATLSTFEGCLGWHAELVADAWNELFDRGYTQEMGLAAVDAMIEVVRDHRASMAGAALNPDYDAQVFEELRQQADAALDKLLDERRKVVG